MLENRAYVFNKLELTDAQGGACSIVSILSGVTLGGSEFIVSLNSTLEFKRVTSSSVTFVSDKII